MELKLVRETFREESTIGRLFINGVFHCYTLEDKVREFKIPKVTAIPRGRYEITLTFSDHFQELMPLLMKVPDYEGVRIHWGNYSADTDGCILVGSTYNVNFIGNSRYQYKKLFTILKNAIKTEKIFITIQ